MKTESITTSIQDAADQVAPMLNRATDEANALTQRGLHAVQDGALQPDRGSHGAIHPARAGEVGIAGCCNRRGTDGRDQPAKPHTQPLSPRAQRPRPTCCTRYFI